MSASAVWISQLIGLFIFLSSHLAGEQKRQPTVVTAALPSPQLCLDLGPQVLPSVTQETSACSSLGRRLRNRCDIQQKCSQAVLWSEMRAKAGWEN